MPETPSKADKDDGVPSQEKEGEIQRLNMLVKQRDNEIGILLNYLNKQKEQKTGGDDFGQGVPVESAYHQKQIESEDSTQKEESKQGTLFQMMGGKQNNYNKSIAEKRMDFELNQQTAQAK